MNYVGNNLGMGFGPLLGGLAAAYSYDIMFAGNILAGLVCAVLIALWVPRDRHRRAGNRKDKGAPRPARTSPRPAGVLVSFFYVVPLIGLEYTLPLAVTTVLDESAGLVGAVYTINSVVVVGLGLVLEKRMRGHGTTKGSPPPPRAEARRADPLSRPATRRRRRARARPPPLRRARPRGELARARALPPPATHTRRRRRRALAPSL